MDVSSRRLAAAALTATLALAARPASADPVKLRFTSNWKLDAAAALILAGQDLGFYSAEGLDVTVDPGTGAVGTVNRISNGQYELGLGDLNAIAEANAKSPGPGLRAVYVVANYPPWAIISLKKSGFSKPADLAGHRLGAPGFDGARKMWPLFAARAQLPKGAVSWISMDPADREPMLVQGRVDAISGHGYTTIAALEHLGVAQKDLVVFNYAEVGIKMYGDVVVVNPQFAAAHPEQVKAFLRALTKSLKAVIADPGVAIKALKKRDPSIDEAVELTRLKFMLEHNLITPDVRADGLGGVREQRLQGAIAEVVSSLGLSSAPRSADLFDESYLPSKADRLLPR